MINVAILGFGTVGSGVAEVLRTNEKLIDQRTGETVRLKYIVDIRDFPDSEFADCFTKDFAVVEADPEVNIVVETIGGKGVALDFTTRALKAGKSVVSSNKELVATHGYELLQLAKEHGANYLFEASVGGGIPVLRPLSNCLAGNAHQEVCGILNGTTNYILTQMIQSGWTFDEALKDAQAMGFAEQDPTADVDGHDACRKICILGAIAFGQHINPDLVATQGIRPVTLGDVDYAGFAGYQIKLLGRAIAQGDKVCAFVAPHLVPATSPLSSVHGVFNAVSVKGNAVGEVMFYGPGAGKLPTASAVVGDVVDLAKDIKTNRCNSWGPGAGDMIVGPEDMVSKFYVRLTATVSEAEEKLGIVRPLSRQGAPAGECAVLTSAMTQAQLEEKLSGVEIRALFRILE